MRMWSSVSGNSVRLYCRIMNFICVIVDYVSDVLIVGCVSMMSVLNKVVNLLSIVSMVSMLGVESIMLVKWISRKLLVLIMLV